MFFEERWFIISLVGFIFIDILILILIWLGAAIMVANIVLYIIFSFRMRDVISGGVKRDNVMLAVGLILIVFFLVGYIYVAIYADPSIVTAFILFFGSIFVSLAIALLNILINTSKQRSLEIAQILISVIDSRAPSLQGHSLHVKNLMTVFYKHLPRHLKGEFNEISLEYAALFHDIGKLELPIEILNNEGNLNEEEQEIMRSHPQIGVRLLRPIKSFDYISDWILFHHERVDGEGYYFKKADSIPFPSKMIAIIDAYSAITMGRVYSHPETYEKAIEIIKENAGTKYDQELVDIFVSIPKKEIEACTPNLENIKHNIK